MTLYPKRILQYKIRECNFVNGWVLIYYNRNEILFSIFSGRVVFALELLITYFDVHQEFGEREA